MRRSFIFFDCMETLIDMYDLPGEREYALWAYDGSGVETYWNNAEEFISEFLAMRKYLKDKVPTNKEYDLRDRLKIIVEKKMNLIPERNSAEIIENLFKNFWLRYKAQCYISEEVVNSLKALSEKYKIGVVSNFVVEGGIEELLNRLGIDKYIDFVVTSVKEGWRKPHHIIYERALVQAQATAAEVIFIGDDYLNDYITPLRIGFKTLLYDRKGQYPRVTDRFESFTELKDMLYRKDHDTLVQG